MNSLLIAVIVAMTTCFGVTIASNFLSEPSNDNADENELQPQFSLEQKSPSDQAYLAWVRYLFRNTKNLPQSQKRFLDYAIPHMRLPQFSGAQKKRNNGIWIWMPAQGYVSVPRQQQGVEAIAADEAGKPGKIMRYGK